MIPCGIVRALVLGAGGQLGSELVALLPGATGLLRQELSVSDRAGIEAACAHYRPDVLFNCAAYNAVDRAETEPELAYAINAAGAENVAIACSRRRIRLVHFSTNFVFDGRLDRPYTEEDEARPLSAYGRSKLEGERSTLTALPEALVVRTAAVFGDRGSAIKGGSFPQRIVERARSGQQVRVVSDQRVNPTYAGDLARAAIDLAAGELNGVVHVVAAGCCAWDEFARAALAASGVEGEVQPITTADLAAAAGRPLNGCLESVRTDSLRPWLLGVEEWAAAFGEGRGITR
ncbi:MAG TPA: dTDP-4-dehydrorhamnose reductase [Candidatus Dormibacteraeota bacterium]